MPKRGSASADGVTPYTAAEGMYFIVVAARTPPRFRAPVPQFRCSPMPKTANSSAPRTMRAK